MERRDFFVSYNQADKVWAEWIAWQLDQAGYTVRVQAWDFVGGMNFAAQMQQASTLCTRTIAVLSEQYLASEFGAAEWLAAFAADPVGEQRKVLVARVANCGRPGLLGPIIGIDLFDREEPAAKDALLRYIRGAVTGSNKPDVPPRFPGHVGTSAPMLRRGDVQAPTRFPGRGPSVWSVPDRNPNFVGRAVDLEQVGQDLLANGAVAVEAMHAMGGIGKTQLATEFCHRYASNYEVVWWFRAEQPELLPEQYAALAHAMGLNPPPDENAVRTAVHSALRDCPSWLLVFDNAERPHDVRRYYPTTLRPAGHPGHVLVTTRREGFREIGQVRRLDVISTSEAVALMRTRVPDITDADAEAIAAEVGCLPLAVEQAAAYLEQQAGAVSPAAYLRLLTTRTGEMLGRGRPANHQDTIATLWRLSFDTVEQQNPAAVQLLSICAYLAPDAIPLDLFSHHPEQLPAQLASTVRDELLFAEAVGVLTGYSLASLSGRDLTLHRMVQAALRDRDHAHLFPASVE